MELHRASAAPHFHNKLCTPFLLQTQFASTVQHSLCHIFIGAPCVITAPINLQLGPPLFTPNRGGGWGAQAAQLQINFRSAALISRWQQSSYTLAPVGVQVGHLGLAIDQKTWAVNSLTQEYLHCKRSQSRPVCSSSVVWRGSSNSPYGCASASASTAAARRQLERMIPC